MQTKLSILASIFIAIFGLCVYMEHNITSLISFIIGVVLYLIAFISRDKKDKKSNKIDYLSEAIKAYKEKGTPKYYIDKLDLTLKEKSKLYDDAVMAGRGRPAKNNPYRF